MNPLVSIIVPCYNQAQYLPETLDSLLAQTYPYWECIIVNDGSPDNTEEVAKAYCEKDKRFKYLYKENGGVSSARNEGIKTSSGEYILPLDADDKIGIQYLEKAIQHFKLFPDTKLVYCKAELFGTENGLLNLPEYDYQTLLFENLLFSSAIIRSDDVQNKIEYNLNMKQGLEDWDFWLSLLNEHDSVYQIPEVCFYYRIKEKSRNQGLKEGAGNLLRAMYYNHKEKYEEYIPDIISLKRQVLDQEKIIFNLEYEIKRLILSKGYRLGKFLLKPFSIIKKIFFYYRD